MASLAERVEALNRASGQQLGVLKAVQGILGQINSQVKNIKSIGGGPGNKIPKAPDEATGGLFKTLGKVGKALGAAGLIVGAAVAAFAAIPLAIAGVVSASESFVKAINPSQVERYEAAQADLSATIGSGLVPVIAYATKSLREWAGILLPSITELRPVVERISAAVSGFTAGPIRLLATTLSGIARGVTLFLPSIEKIVSGAGAIFEVLSALSNALDGLGLMFGGTKTILEVAGQAMQRLAVNTAIAAARLASLVGGADAVAKFRDSLKKAIDDRKNPKAGLTAAPTDATTGGITDVLRKLNERSFLATTGADAKKSETDLLEEMLEAVKEVEADPKEWKQVIKEAVIEAFKVLVPGGDAAVALVGAPDASAGGDRSGFRAGGSPSAAALGSGLSVISNLLRGR